MARPKTDSAARSILETQLGIGTPDLAAEARRQSQLVARRRSERETLAFILDVADSSR